jgi:uncharacterized protein YhaN
MERSIDDDLALLDSLDWDDSAEIAVSVEPSKDSLNLSSDSDSDCEENDERSRAIIDELAKDIQQSASTREIQSNIEVACLQHSEELSLVSKSGDAKIEITHDMLRNWESSCMACPIDETNGPRQTK